MTCEFNGLRPWWSHGKVWQLFWKSEFADLLSLDVLWSVRWWLRNAVYSAGMSPFQGQPGPGVSGPSLPMSECQDTKS